MLGVDAPVSFELLRQIVLGVVVNTIVALPMWALVRRVLDGALPEDPRRRRRRRAYTTGGLSPLSQRMSAIEPARGRRSAHPGLAAAGAARGDHRRLAMVMFGVIFFRLWYLQVLSGEQYVAAGQRQPRARPADRRRRAGEILDREGQPIVTSRVTNAVQIVPSALPPAGRAAAARCTRRLGRLLGMSAAHIEALVITRAHALCRTRRSRSRPTPGRAC